MIISLDMYTGRCASIFSSQFSIYNVLTQIYVLTRIYDLVYIINRYGF
ncbi:MAG: hypothetical protein ACD_37C00089G0003 [uncultured bacterium]|nr:MAG: hypothetical protein ACD_37C00089G0003 [uncultured bacterium]